jgi:hypothetical protein
MAPWRARRVRAGLTALPHETNSNPVSKQAVGKHIKSWFFAYVIFVWFWWWCCRCEIGALTRDFLDLGPCLHPFLDVDTEKLMTRGSTWYSACSFWPDLPNAEWAQNKLLTASIYYYLHLSSKMFYVRRSFSFVIRSSGKYLGTPLYTYA